MAWEEGPARDDGEAAVLDNHSAELDSQGPWHVLIPGTIECARCHIEITSIMHLEEECHG